MSTLKNLSTETKEIQAQIRKMAQEKVTPALQQALIELREKVPAVQAVNWRQYTPYFNDGDECTFSVHGVYFLLEGVDPESGDYGDGFDSPWGLKYHKKIDEATYEALNSFENDLGNIESLLKEALGDHAKVTLSAKGIEVDEYSHD